MSAPRSALGGRLRAWLRRALPQIFRKSMQLGVLLFIVYSALGGLFRNYNLAHNSRRLVGLIHGELWGTLFGWNEDLLLLFGEDDHELSLAVLGFPWTGRLLGLDTADPLAALTLALRAHRVPWGMLLSLLVPLGLGLLFGKIFCSHLCPARLVFELGEAVRRGLLRLGLPLPELRVEARLGGWVLLGGVLATLLSTSAVWILILPYVSLSVGLFVLASTGVVSGAFAVIGLWLAAEILLAPGLFCHAFCPTGFLLEQLGRVAPFRLRKKGAAPCPSGCDLCERACPYGLRPKELPSMPGRRDPACDKCGRCVAACPSDRLDRGFGWGKGGAPKASRPARHLPVIGAALLLLLPASEAAAHHNKGLPHYGYFENYPQVPTEEYVAIDGDWEIGATVFNFQGYDRRSSDTPNDVKIYLYLYDLRADRAFTGPVDIEIRQGETLIARYERTEVDEESVYSTRQTLPESGDYELVAVVEGRRVVLPFHVEIEDGVSWLLLFGLAAPLLFLFGLALYGRKRGRRRRRRRGPGKRTAATTALLALLFTAAAASLSLPLPVAAQRDTQQAASAAREQAPDPAACGPEGEGASMRHVITAEGPLMVMSGLPLWLFLAGFGAILALSFVATEKLAPRLAVLGGGPRFNLIRRPKVYRLMRSRWLQAVPQLLMAALLIFLVYAGLAGSRVANITPTAVWTIWWAGLIFTVLFLGSAWCFACPWDGLASLASRLRLAARVEPLSLGRRFPEALKNLYPAIALFVLLTWLELGWGVTTDPRATAYLGLGMIALAIAGALLWDGKRFCEHFCPVGRICGLYSLFAPIEIRARNPKVCARCTTEDCKNGNEHGYRCPTGISLKVIQSSAMCTMCTECIKSCDKHNVALNLRPFGADLRPDHAPRKDLAWLAVILLSLTLFHGLSMTSAWESFEPGRWSLLKALSAGLGLPRALAFSLAMAAACALPIGLYGLSCWAGARLGGDPKIAAGELFRRYSLSLLPVALFYHLAHNLMHLLMEGGHIVPLLSDPLGRGWDLLGTASTHVGPLLDEESLWVAQILLILIGHVFGIVVAHRVGHRLYGEPSRATRSLIPMLLMMVLLSGAGLGLMHLDMNMRLGRM